MSKEKEPTYQDWKYEDNIIKIQPEVDVTLPCVICGKSPQDKSASLELQIKGEWMVVCNVCAPNHCEMLMEALNDHKRYFVVEMEALRRVIFELKRTRMELGS